MRTTGPVNILCVDDDPQFVDLTATFLGQNDEQFSVVTATSAQDGLEECSVGDLDCIISDYDMDGLNGIEFLKIIRTEYPDLPFILFTGRGSEEVASEAISAGTTDYMQKGGGTDQYEVLAQRAQNAISRYQTNRLLEDTIDAVEASIFVVDEHDHYLLMNREARGLLGIGDEIRVVGKTNDELFSDELAAQFRENNRAVIESGSPVEFEQEVPTRYGATQYLTRINPLFDEHDEVYACCGIATELNRTP